MWKRDLLRYVPRLSKLVEALDDYEGYIARLTMNVCQLATENQQRAATIQQLAAANLQLKKLLQRLVFSSETPLVEDEGAGAIEGSDGLPVPAAVLRFLVAGTEDLPWFLRSGKLGAQSLVDVLARQGKTLNQFQRVLDFGCGCGRVTRHLKGLTGAEVHGSDSNPHAVHWCEQYLSFARFQVNSLAPPLPYAAGTFDFVYAFSVVTHLTEPLQAQWMEELRRILTPGGYLLLSVHGDACLEWLMPAERAEYRKGELVIRDGDVAGTNYCRTHHPESYVRGVLARGFEVVDFIPEGAKGNPPQDAYLLRPRASTGR